MLYKLLLYICYRSEKLLTNGQSAGNFRVFIILIIVLTSHTLSTSHTVKGSVRITKGQDKGPRHRKSKDKGPRQTNLRFVNQRKC